VVCAVYCSYCYSLLKKLLYRWTVGPNWPSGGEIDVLDVTGTNKMTCHTNEGCTVDLAEQTGTLSNANCISGDGDNTGCGVVDNDPPLSGRASMMRKAAFSHMNGYPSLGSAFGTSSVLTSQRTSPTKHLTRTTGGRRPAYSLRGPTATLLTISKTTS
jgi:hypothetical protein